MSTITFRAPDGLTNELARRGEMEANRGPGRPSSNPLNQIARRDLERYYAMLAFELRTLALSEREACLVCDANNGTLWDLPELACQSTMLWANVADAIRINGLDEKWNAEDAFPTGPPVDGDQLVRKLQKMTPGQTPTPRFALSCFGGQPRSAR